MQLHRQKVHCGATLLSRSLSAYSRTLTACYDMTRFPLSESLVSTAKRSAVAGGHSFCGFPFFSFLFHYWRHKLQDSLSLARLQDTQVVLLSRSRMRDCMDSFAVFSAKIPDCLDLGGWLGCVLAPLLVVFWMVCTWGI